MVTISSSSAQSGARTHGALRRREGRRDRRSPGHSHWSSRRDGITVNTIAPGMIDTPMLRGAAAGGDVGQLEKVVPRMIPVGRVGSPEEIAAACGFLCSDDAGFITGQVVGVNGGMVL